MAVSRTTGMDMDSPEYHAYERARAEEQLRNQAALESGIGRRVQSKRGAVGVLLSVNRLECRVQDDDGIVRVCETRHVTFSA